MNIIHLTSQPNYHSARPVFAGKLSDLQTELQGTQAGKITEETINPYEAAKPRVFQLLDSPIKAVIVEGKKTTITHGDILEYLIENAYDHKDHPIAVYELDTFLAPLSMAEAKSALLKLRAESLIFAELNYLGGTAYVHRLGQDYFTDYQSSQKPSAQPPQ